MGGSGGRLDQDDSVHVRHAFVREREWKGWTVAHGVRKIIIICAAYGFSTASQKEAGENIIIFGGSYWLPKISCYFQLLLKNSRFLVVPIKVVNAFLDMRTS
jgi:hypothetical protein